MNADKIVQLNVNDVLPNRFQPRIKFNEDSINELSESIKKYGVIEPIVVRAIGDKYEIIAGERRYKASLLAGKETVPGIITTLDDKDSAEVALIENVQREDLTPIEEAISYKKILDMGYLTQDELATKLGKNQSTVANKLRLLNLCEDVQEALLEEKISERHARSLLKLKDENDQIQMLNKIISERLTVRKTDEEINKILKPVSSVEIREEKGVSNMNEFNPVDFVSPTSVAEEAKVSPVEELALPKDEALIIPDNSANPGFMDINKIEQTAQSINQTRAEVDLDSLLASMPSIPMVPEVEKLDGEVEQPVEIPTVSVEPTDDSNKFFNIPFLSDGFDKSTLESQNSVDLPVVENPVVGEIPAVPAEPVDVTKSFNFNFEPVTVEAKPMDDSSIDNLSIFSSFANLSSDQMPAEKKDMVLEETLSVPSINYSDAESKVASLESELTLLGYAVSLNKEEVDGKLVVTLTIQK